MRQEARICGVAGGALVFTAAVAALIAGGADTVIVSGWITIAAAVLAIAGAALDARRGLAALLMTGAVLAVGLVAPGVLPAIGSMTAVILGYLAGSALLLTGAILALRRWNVMRAGTPVAHGRT